MIYLFFIVIIFLLGRGALRALYGNSKAQDITYADSIPTGLVLIIGLAEAAHMGALVLGRSFSDCVKLFLGGLIVLLLAAVVVLVWNSHREKKGLSKREAERLRVKKVLGGEEEKQKHHLLLFGVGIMILIQLLQLLSESEPYLVGDMTVETVNSILATDAVYQVNPLTGQAYTLGMPLRLKILCLPTLYAILCEVFDMSAAGVVWTVAPVFTLLGCYAAFYTVAGALFNEDTQKKGIFMLFVALILGVGNSMYGMDGFALQFAGFRGVSIRMLILVPYTFGLVLRRKWKLVVLCILAEACIVWTLYGLGACAAVTGGMLLAGLLADKWFGQDGKVAST